MSVLLNGRRDDFVDTPVVAEVDHFSAMSLYEAAHYIDRCVVSVEQRRRGDKAKDRIRVFCWGHEISCHSSVSKLFQKFPRSSKCDGHERWNWVGGKPR